MNIKLQNIEEITVSLIKINNTTKEKNSFKNDFTIKGIYEI